MFFVDQSTSTAITHATTFLTQPLFLTHSTLQITSLQLILQSTLTTAFLSSCPGTLRLSLSPIIPPPRAIHAACIAANLPWSTWISVLGGSAFELCISSSCVSVHMPDGRSTAVWGSLPPVPSALVRPMPASKSNLITTLRSSLKRRTRPPTLAQQLLESSHEDKEADEMFTLLSKCDISVVSPTPTRSVFPPALTRDTLFVPSSTHSVHFVSFTDSDSDLHSEPDSRPSSRSSSTSDASLSSFASESHSFHSSISSVSSSVSSPKPQEETYVLVDIPKTTPTKYMYAGGVSTVLTGGVMLGSSTPVPASRLTRLTEKASVPVWRPRIRGPNAESWRWAGGRAVGAGR